MRSNELREVIMKAIAIVGAALALVLSRSVAHADPPPSSAYVTDPQNSYVEDATSRGIGQVNMITCIMAALRRDALVNDGRCHARGDHADCGPNARSLARNANNGARASTFVTDSVDSPRGSKSDSLRAEICLGDAHGSSGALI